ncbi:hypothetical protein CBW65_05600 [Tumebacillus avium]|uniref:Uncharacterized protein n=1 Tax=Tumebacillus avium TaxID=1903704 RepID=A0A1Y0IMN1_9BACL|nr:hypothetical protein [Tumebacillus avium]ARU60614.1 hypothetical protein CBW65_05600 [Tumebacillus avium]
MGTIIAGLHIVREVVPWISNDLPAASQLTPFTKWIGMDAFSFESNLLYLLLPLLAAIVYADSYLLDEKSGFTKSIYTRVSKGKYLISKFLVTFLTGAMAVLVPLFIHLLVTAMLLPSMMPDPASGTSPMIEGKMWLDFYYEHPYAYIFSYMLIDMLFAGALATFGLAVSVFVKKRFVVLLAPFLLYLFLFFILQLLGLPAWIPFKFLQPGQTVLNITVLKIASELVVVLGLSAAVFLTEGKRRETY